MTQAERLVRNICDDAKRRITQEQDVETSKEPENVRASAAPADVRRALATLKTLTPRLAAAKAVITAHGFTVPNLSCACDGDEDDEPKSLTVDYRYRGKKTGVIREKHQRRLAQVETLRNAATVATLGLNGDRAKPALDKLQRDLAAI